MTVQRGKEVDKSVMNAASYLYVCQHNTDDVAKYMAKKLGVEINEIPRQSLAFTLWSPSKRLLRTGSVYFLKAVAKFIYTRSKKRIPINQLASVIV